MAHPVLANDFPQLNPEAAMLSESSLKPTSPCPALSAGTELMSQGHCQK